MEEQWVDLQDDDSPWGSLARKLRPKQWEILSAAITEVPDSDQWVDTREVLGGASRPGATGYLIPKTRIFVNLRAMKEWHTDVYLLLGMYSVGQDLTLSAVVTTLRKLHAAVAQLSDDEVELIGVITGLARGANPYSTPVDEDSVRAAYAGATLDVNRLLDSLESKCAIKRVREGKLQLVL